MIERCPGCGAKGPGSVVCRRCGAELQWLTRIQDASHWSEQQIVACLVNGETDLALEQLAQAMQLKQTPMLKTLAGFAIWMDSQKRQRKLAKRLGILS